MSTKYPGGLITKNPVTPAGPYETGSAPGVWTVDQALQYTKQGIWPTQGNVDPSAFIENLFSTYLYTGNGSTQTITNGIDLAGKGGLTWIKIRNTAYVHVLTDTARGVSKYLDSSTTGAQSNTSPYGLTSFNADGFSLKDDSPGNYGVNGNGYTFASWTFRKQPKFFDIVTYTGNGGTQSIAHNLGSVPGCIIVKPVSASGAWPVYHRSINIDYPSYLNTTAAATGPNTIFGIAPTSTQFYVWTSNETNQSGVQYVAYLFAHNAGGFGLTGTDNVISCGSYTGSGAAGNPITLGYEPQFLMVKNITTGGAGYNWQMMDTMRGMSLTSMQNLAANLSDAETSPGAIVYPTATGFAFNYGSGGWNGASQTYIYIAIRRGPMKVPTSGTSVFSPTANAGTGSQKTVTTNFPVDLTINSALSAATHVFTDRLRGGGVDVSPRLYSQFTDAETNTSSGRGILFDSNTGFTLTSNYINASGDNYIYYGMRRAPGFFDEVCYTGNNTAGTTISHNLGVTPELMIIKSRSASGNWPVYSAATGNTKVIYLNYDTYASASNEWNNTTPTASVFTLGTNSSVNNPGTTYVAYLFATCAGVSKVGSYTGTGTTLQINCGFTGGARFVMIKRYDSGSTGDWYVWDSARGIVAGNDPYLLLNSTAAEVTNTDYVDTYSAGFEISSTAPAAINASGGTFIYLAIA